MGRADAQGTGVPDRSPRGNGLAPVLCVFGTGSDVGKSWIVTGLCRLARRAGLAVVPYKAQNMSNNAAVTPLGGEIGRAQHVQAEAAGVVPHVDMNPILLKPNTDTGSQVIVLGRARGNQSARAWFADDIAARRRLVLAALDRLRARADLVIAEGAGSCAEVNLRGRDVVNMPVAHHADAPVVLVADIHRGGVFAQVVGTLEVMDAADRARVAGVIVNRFRGDVSLFEDGRRWLERRTGLPVLGVVPWTRAARIESEDGLPVDARVDPPPPAEPDRLHVAVIRLPHIANFTDFDALEAQGVAVHYLATPRDLAPYDAVILPGSKNTRGDLAWLRRSGHAARIREFHAAGGHVLGICGGYQMLGRGVADPHGVEGPPGETSGLGLLPVETTLARTKTVTRTRGRLLDAPEVAVAGYEIHAGRTRRDPGTRALAAVEARTGQGAAGLAAEEEAEDALDGAISGDGRVRGTYLHGIFDEPGAARALLGPLRPELPWPEAVPSPRAWRDAQYDILADHLAGCLDLGALWGLVGLPGGTR